MRQAGMAEPITPDYTQQFLLPPALERAAGVRRGSGGGNRRDDRSAPDARGSRSQPCLSVRQWEKVQALLRHLMSARERAWVAVSTRWIDPHQCPAPCDRLRWRHVANIADSH